MAKNALQKIEDHEKLCRIMQKQTHDKINKLERQINRVESISTGVYRSFDIWYGLCYIRFNH
jgi:hypothetical protein